ncbi:hypothetical protein FRC04_000816 [Tulasnella sp. 424]|nr:hypothetical protein FRC04_000816 [Tulasnella sp. 424]
MSDSTPGDQQNVETSHGRSFQQGDHTYALPTDNGEHSRLDLQHEAVRIMLEGRLYQTPELVRQALAQAEDGTINILDVGAGSGRWAIEMSEEFADAKVLGIDLALPSVLSDTTRSLPSNCSFRVLDVNQDLAKLDLTFNVIHTRFVEPGINDTDLFFYDVARLLRPEGALLLVGANAQIVDDQGKVFPLHKPGEVGTLPAEASLLEEVSVGPPAFMPWMGDMHYDGAEAMSFNLVSMLESNPNYSRINVSEIPNGVTRPVEMTEAQRKLSEIMQKNLLLLLPAFKAIMLRDGGFPSEFAENLFEGSRKEIEELPPAVRGYANFVFVTAVRSDMPWVPRTQPWQEPPGYDVYDYIIRPL